MLYWWRREVSALSVSPGSEEAHTIKDWRTKVYFETQEEFARRLGVDVTTLSSWETGRKRPRLATQRKIAEALGIHPSHIILPEEKENPAAA